MLTLKSQTLISTFIFSIVSLNTLAHEQGAQFSGAIIDPLRVHHAHIEDEQRLNFSTIDNTNGKNTYSNSLELAINWDDDFRWGSEIFIPYSNDGGNGSAVGDIDLQLVKYAFLNEPETVITGLFGISLPTGNKSKGLGGENTGLEMAMFVDKAYQNWYGGLNLELATVVDGETETEFEIATALSYSFIQGTVDFAPTTPEQQFVPALSLELISGSVIRGAAKGTDVATLVPGLHLWHPKSDWSLRFGVEMPVSSDKENERVYLLQLGTHKNWSKIFD